MVGGSGVPLSLFFFIYLIFAFSLRDKSFILTDGRTDGVLFEAQKTMFFGNISKNKKYFFMVVFAPPRRVFNTTFVKISKVFKKIKIF